MIKINATQEQQNKAILYISNTFKQYKDIMQPYQDRMLDIYTELSSFKEKKLNDWSTSFKVNKAHEISNKISPRIISKDPKWIVNYKPDFVWEQLVKNTKVDEQIPLAIQDLLSSIFAKQNLNEVTRLWAKSMINYGAWFAKVKRKYEIGRKLNKVDKEETYIDENWVEQVRKIDKQIDEYVSGEYSTIDIVSWADLYYDLRYNIFDDMPAVIEIINGVRLSELKKDKKYFNLDKLDDIVSIDMKDFNSYKKKIQSLLGIDIESTEWVDRNNLKLKKFYGLYDMKEDGDERLYEICTVNDMVVISFEEISQMPFVQIRCFEDTETNEAVGFIEPILGLQRELNFKKNSASEYINQSLNRSWIWSAYSGINPKKLISKANNIISTTKTVEEALKNLQELPHREINAGYFQEQNDFERQIQGLSFTVDTSNPKSQQSLTNTATGARIRFYESNIVIDEVRKHFEQWLVKLAYKLLQDIEENATENMTIKNLQDWGFWNIHKDAIIDAIKKFEIQIEAGSSSFDSIDERRDNAIAKYNLWLAAKQAGVNVDLDSLLVDVFDTFEGMNGNKYVTKAMPQLPMGMWGWSPLQAPESAPSTAEATTQAVAQGNLLW